MLYRPHLYYIFYFLVSLSLTASFQNSLQTRINLHKIVSIMSKNCLLGGVAEKEGGRREIGRKSALVVGSIDAPENKHNYHDADRLVNQNLKQPRGRGFDSGRGIIRATTLGKLFTPNVPLFTKQYNLEPCEGLRAKAPYCGSGPMNRGSRL